MVIETRWKYPLNWDGMYFDLPGRPKGWQRMVLNITATEDVDQGDETSGYVVVDRSSLIGVEGKPCYKMQIDKIDFMTYGTGVQLDYDMTPDQRIVTIPQSDSGTYLGPFIQEVTEPGGYTAGETGNIVITTVGTSLADYFDITLYMRIKERPQAYGTS